ncbi:MAG: excinuclease ABC subunit A [Candidatus Lloydbacteria bacterium RIFCSPLOWO2_01_FULL_50_20]|uniref:UvrABC system protein A n=1 Tax=Candidatus Lloydbacteria bacterium RIFCSPLOWO2_01_FULL_50_20 TaxID=1798665 RepID=A0A1G2DCU3_9BACT|nr:MAG: excinuclease ABC subunit A [Candidatus Lloydbacteria bacterium RIFCSPLOWO2_01_FULL_50_20]
MKEQSKIIVKGARTHNLKNITVTMPRNKMIVFTGLSGSGKSSLAFDTIFAEGQRRYVESLSAYARQFLHQMQKPDVDEIVGLSPAISIDQKSHSSNPRSTVATITEIYDYLRVLFARVGIPHCLLCGKPIKRLTNEEIMGIVFDRVEEIGKHSPKDEVMGVPYSTLKVGIYAPLVRGRKGEYYQLLYDYLSKGYSKARIDGKQKNLREQIILAKQKKHDVDILVDEFFVSEFRDNTKGVRERLSEAVERALGEAEGLVRLVIGDEETLMSAKFACPDDGFSYPEVEPRLFSFNSPYGACQTCNGLGTKHFFGDEPCEVCGGKRLREEALHVTIGDPVVEAKRASLQGKHKKTQESRGKSIVEVTDMSIEEASRFFGGLTLTPMERQISSVVIKEIESRLSFMLDVGIGYLTLGRRANTLSGGEAQRIRLASQLGSRLVGALYVLDEPTIGLHQKDNDRLIKTLRNLCDIGNTIIVVEHDEDTIFASDYLVDIGPGAGVHGGHIVASGYLEDLLLDKKAKSLTLDYLRKDKQIPLPEKRRVKDKGALGLRGGKAFNITNMNVDIPLGRLVTVTGVSGSGKSTFLYELIYKNLQARFDRRYRSPKTYNCAEFTGTEYLHRAILIDQSPIGRTPRSNPATYTGAWTFVRDLFAETEEARVRGWRASRFSFNVKGGRCEACEGNGMVAVEMHFLPTVYVLCDVCQGKRFQKETLEVKFKKKNIYEVLKMTVEEACEFFRDIPAIEDRLKTLNDVGLGYLELGQSATTLSGGEAQRVKIASELYRPFQQRTIYLLDEPTIGLHYEDVKKLIEILQALVEKGNSVLMIEHNLDVIKSSDYVIDIGPDGGSGGGQLVARGTPEEIANNPKSYTGKYLKRSL